MTATLLETVELDNSSSTIVVNSISQDYDDLLIYVSGRNATSGSNRGLVYPNGVSADLTETGLQGSGSSIGSISHQFVINYNDDTANAFSNCHTYIENYSSTSQAKAMHSMFANETNAVTAFVGMASSLWDNTSAITSLEFHLNDGTFAAGSKVTIYGIIKTPSEAKATGGNISTDGVYFYHTFMSSGTFTPIENINAEYLVVAGGGGGGNVSYGGAGGAGGYLTGSGALTAQNYTITVGSGGAYSTDNSSPGSQGSNSSAFGITSTGGGGGGSYFGFSSSSAVATDGGSGGGSGSSGSGGSLPGSGISGQGNDGGNAVSALGAGGGGAAQVGGTGGGLTGGDGGDGKQWLNGSYYAGGGSGGADQRVNGSYSFGDPGLGGGGSGAISQSSGSVAATPGAPATGGGGGAGSPGSGGSGVVIIRYAA